MCFCACGWLCVCLVNVHVCCVCDLSCGVVCLVVVRLVFWVSLCVVVYCVCVCLVCD